MLSIIGCLLLGMCVIRPVEIVAQGPSQIIGTPSATSTTPVNVADNKLFFTRENTVVEWDPTSLKEIPFATFNTDQGVGLGLSQVSPEGQFAYFIEGVYPKNLTPMYKVPMRFVQFDP